MSAIIQVEGLSKAYSYKLALKQVSFEVERQSFLGILGHNGSGKSTLIKLLCGLSKPTSGHITIGGWSIPQELGAVRAQIGLVSHALMLSPMLTARENLRFYGQLYDVPSLDERMSQLLEMVGLARFADQPIKTFSRGMQQRLSIARAFLHQPAILLLDEPFTGLDQTASKMLISQLEQAQTDGRTIVMVTHQVELALQYCDRLLVLSRGQLQYEGRAIDFSLAQYEEILMR